METTVAAVDFLAVLQNNSRRGAVFGDDLGNFAAVRISAPKLLGGAGQSLREIADAAADKACRAQRAVRFAKLVMEQVESGSLLARADEGTEHAACCQAPL